MNRIEFEEFDNTAVAYQVAREVARQDATYGPFSDDASSVRLAVACLEDEVREVREAWDKWKRRYSPAPVRTTLPGRAGRLLAASDWYALRQEAIQVAAVASRLARLRVEITG